MIFFSPSDVVGSAGVYFRPNVGENREFSKTGQEYCTHPLLSRSHLGTFY